MTNRKKLLLEVCANGIESASSAQKADVDRIELCEHLEVDGLTPAPQTIERARKQLHIRMHVLIRPRAGDFVYSEKEFEVMKEEILFCKTQNAEGVVFGILKKDGSVDTERCKELIALSGPMSLTFHRAFDVAKNPVESLEEIISLGFDRILTSGQKSTCLEGSEMIAQLVKQAAGRISIMAGGGITEENIAQVVKRTHTNEFHFSAKMKSQDGSLVSDLNRIRKIKEVAVETFDSLAS